MFYDCSIHNFKWPCLCFTFFHTLIRIIVHTFLPSNDLIQGRDMDAVLLSLVRSNDQAQSGALLNEWRRVNVALTRATQKLVRWFLLLFLIFDFSNNSYSRVSFIFPYVSNCNTLFASRNANYGRSDYLWLSQHCSSCTTDGRFAPASS